MPHDLPRTTVTGGGLWREKVAHTEPSGDNALSYIVSDYPVTKDISV